MKSLPKWLRVTLVTVLSLALLGGAAYGVLLLIRGKGAAVPVYAVADVSTFASAGNAETQGKVTTDRIQSVYVTSTQEITEINVHEGQRVSVGDPLLSFDTTLTDLELERQDIAVRRTQLDLDTARQHLAEINTYRVYTPAAPGSDPTLIPTAVGVPRKGTGTQEDPYVYVWNNSCVYTEAFFDGLLPHLGAEPVAPVYAVFEIRSGDSLMGGILSCWEMVFTRNGDDSWSFVYTSPVYDPSTGLDDDGSAQDIPTGPVYTWTEIANMRKDAEQKIADLELKLKVEQLKYETLEYELANGVVTSRIDGVVKTVRSVEEARETGDPLVLVSGGGGYYVTGAMSETELATMKLGDTVSVLSWETYERLDGTITEISEFPAAENDYSYYHYSNGNQNVSLFPFTVFLPEDAKLREGEYVQMTYDPSSSSGTGLCLMNAFIRTENGRSYVWVAGEEGLERREVRTGRNLYGSYLEILSGLSRDDLIAFPYGSLKEGAPTVKADQNQLYGY